MAITTRLEDRLDKTVPKKVIKALEDGLFLVTNEVYTRAVIKCPVDTGNLRNSIGREVNEKEMEGNVYTNVQYAMYIEYGTKYMKAQSFLRPAIYNDRQELVRIFNIPIKRLLK